MLRSPVKEPLIKLPCCKLPNARDQTKYAVCVLEELLDVKVSARFQKTGTELLNTARAFNDGSTKYVDLFNVRRTQLRWCGRYLFKVSNVVIPLVPIRSNVILSKTTCSALNS